MLTGTLGLGAASLSGSGAGHLALQGSPNTVGEPGDDDDEEALRAGIEASRSLYDYGGAGEMSTRGTLFPESCTAAC